MRRATASVDGRRGFTLLELLVVVSILTVLAALSAAAALKFLGVQQGANTKTALVKLQSALDAQWAAVTQRAKDEPIPDGVRAKADFLAMAGNDLHATARARVLYVKLKQRQAFPMTFDEALNPSPLPPLQPYAAFLRGLGVTRSSPVTRPYESAVCLLLALERAPGGGGVKVEDLGVGTVTATLTLANGKQVNYLADGWKSPLVFCRWPTGSKELNPNGPAAGRNDPGDPEGLLNVPGWLATPALATFRLYCHDLPPRTGGPTSFKLVPLIASAGPDKKLDLNPSTLEELGPGAKDNLYSTSAR
jgi:prepilin-type N-terminal cleavage/methylation domain-containing protein